MPLFDGMPTSYAGSYTKTHMALRSALRSSGPDDGYHSDAFQRFLDNIPVIRDRIEAQYAGMRYPNAGFLSNSGYAGQVYSPEVGAVSRTSSDVLIPAFVAAYTGTDARKQWLDPFPSFKDAMASVIDSPAV